MDKSSRQKESKILLQKDFLGEKKVPIHAYYGIQALRAVENFPITGYRVHEELIKALAIVKATDTSV